MLKPGLRLRLGRRLPLGSKLMAVVTAGVAGAGILVLLAAHASGAFISVQPETGAVSGGASVVSDNAASGGQAAKFGAAATPTPSPSPGFNTCTTPSYTLPLNPSNAQDGVTLGGFYVDTDTWNMAGYPGSTQTMYICDYNNWYAIANMNNNSGDGAVKTYPNVHKDFNEPKISTFTNITSSFAHTAPHVGIYEYAYDIWINGVASNGSTELMIWTDNFGQTPCGGTPVAVSLGGRSYKAYHCGSYIAYVDNTNYTSGSLNILSFFNDMTTRGWIPQASTLGAIDYGVEIVSTSGTNAKFEVNNFSLTAN